MSDMLANLSNTTLIGGGATSVGLGGAGVVGAYQANSTSSGSMVPLLEGAAALGLAGGGGWLLYEAHNRADTITKENAELKARNALIPEGEPHTPTPPETENAVQEAIAQEQKPTVIKETDDYQLHSDHPDKAFHKGYQQWMDHKDLSAQAHQQLGMDFTQEHYVVDGKPYYLSELQFLKPEQLTNLNLDDEKRKKVANERAEVLEQTPEENVKPKSKGWFGWGRNAEPKPEEPVKTETVEKPFINPPAHL